MIIITLIKRRKIHYLLHGKRIVLHLNTLEFPSPKDAFLKFGWNWPNGSGEELFCISSMYFRFFIIISPLKRRGPFIWIHLTIFHPRMHCAKFGWNWLSGSWEVHQKLFSLFHKYLPLEKERALHMNPLPLRIHCAKFGWNWPSGSWEDFYIWLTSFPYFIIISPWKRTRPFIINKHCGLIYFYTLKEFSI